MSKTPSLAKRLLKPNERIQLLIAPRTHLEMILLGNLNREYLLSVAGIMNIGVALAASKKRQDDELDLEKALMVVVRLLQPDASLSDDDKKTLRRGVGIADRLISLQPKHVLARAVAYVDHRIANGTALPIHALPE